MSLWKELRLLRLATFARVLRTAAAANARLLVSLHAKQAAVLQISSARIKRSNRILKCRREAAFFAAGPPLKKLWIYAER